MNVPILSLNFFWIVVGKGHENDKLNIKVLILMILVIEYTLGTSKEQSIHLGI